MKRNVIAIAAVMTTMVLSAVAAKVCKEPVVPKEKIAIWNGEDFAGWKLWVQDENFDVNKVWSIKDGVIRCEGKPGGYMRTKTDYADYLLHVEWRWPGKAGNSGVLLHMSEPDKIWPKSIECQLQSGKAGDFWLIGNVRTDQCSNKKEEYVEVQNVRKLKDSSEKPLGEWNVYDIVCKDDWMVVMVNGVLQNVATKATVTSGKICLQSEGTPAEFRNIYIEPLK